MLLIREEERKERIKEIKKNKDFFFFKNDRKKKSISPIPNLEGGILQFLEAKQ